MVGLALVMLMRAHWPWRPGRLGEKTHAFCCKMPPGVGSFCDSPWMGMGDSVQAKLCGVGGWRMEDDF